MYTPAPRLHHALIACLPLVFFSACGDGEERQSSAGEARNLLLVTFDTTRADRLGCYGREGAGTPTLDRLAREGALFERCFSSTPTTLPSHTTLLTGRQPFHHGVRNNGTHFLAPGSMTLAGELARAGFDTGAFVSAVVLDAQFGLDQGFAHYDDDLAGDKDAAAFTYRERGARETTDRALAWLGERGERRWFLWVHYFDPHASYDPPEPFASQFEDSLYEGEIAYADAELGRLLATIEERGELDETLVAMTADHGESLGEHGESTHSIFVYDATTRVPLILRHPSLPSGVRVEQVVSAVDIVPTSLELLGVAPPSGLDGSSLVARMRGEKAEEGTPVAYSESMVPFFNHGWSDLRTLRFQDERYVRAPLPELYDLSADPGELRDLAARNPERLARAASELSAMLPEQEPGFGAGEVRELDEDMRRNLDALGYAQSDPTGGAYEEGGSRADPKERIAYAERHLRAMGLVHAGRLDEAQEQLRALLEEDPGALHTRGVLFTLLIEAGRVREARELLAPYADAPGMTSGALSRLAALDRELGEPGWREWLQLAKKRYPRDATLLAREGEWALADGDGQAAFAAYSRALELDVNSIEALVGLGDLYARSRRFEEAAEVLERAAEIDPGRADTWFNLGVVENSAGNVERAEEHYLRARLIDPDHLRAHVNLGLLLARTGRASAAELSYREALRVEPTELGALFNLGLLLAGQSRRSEAIEVFERAASSHPTRPGPWAQLARQRRGADDAEGSRAAATTWLELEPEGVPPRIALALACEACGRGDEADAWLAEAFSRAPELVRSAAERDPELARLLARRMREGR